MQQCIQGRLVAARRRRPWQRPAAPSGPRRAGKPALLVLGLSPAGSEAQPGVPGPTVQRGSSRRPAIPIGSREKNGSPAPVPMREPKNRVALITHSTTGRFFSLASNCER
jgi:hypothetical protein